MSQISQTGFAPWTDPAQKGKKSSTSNMPSIIGPVGRSPLTNPGSAGSGGPAGGVPWARRASGGVGDSMPGISPGTGAQGYIKGSDGKIRIVKPGETAKVGLGEVYVEGAVPGQPTRASQVQQAAIGDRKAAIDAQKRAQKRFDDAMGLYKTGIGEADASAGDLAGKVEGDLKRSQGSFDEAKKFFRDSVSGYEDRSAKDAAAYAAGAGADMQQQINEIMGDPNMPDDVKQAQTAKLKADYNNNVHRNITGMFSESNAQLASLRQGAGAGLANIAASDAAVTQTYRSMVDGARARAEQYKMAGRDRIAELMTKYPDSAFSMVDTLLQMGKAESTPGAMTTPGFQF